MSSGRRLTIRLSPYAARALERLRAADLPPGAAPRPAQRALVESLLEVYARRFPVANDATVREPDTRKAG